ncbi:MAG: PaaI family thioesterase [Aquirufa sp.]|jgi:acyl-coenzyme A thioesterase 13
MKPNEKIIAYLNANLNKKIADGNPNPITTWLDGTLIKASAGSITAEFTVREDQCNHAQVMHGGIITTILDEIMGMTLITVEIEHLYVTINLHVDFLFGAKAGEKVTAVSEVFRVGKKIANVEAKLYNAEGKLLAKSTSNLAATSIPVQF